MSALRPLVAYLPWQARDSIVRALVSPLMFLLLASGPLWAFVQANPHVSLDDQGSGTAFALTIYANFAGLAVTLGALAVVNQVAALDRDRQYFRFYFAHQVAPWMFYLQRFVVAALLFLAVFALVPLGFGLAVTDVPVLPALRSAGLYALLLGSLSMLCGALTRRDGLALIAVFLGTSVLQQVDRTGGLNAVLHALAVALPPFDLAAGARNAWLAGRPAEWAHVARVVAYSAGMLIASLAVIKRFPLVR